MAVLLNITYQKKLGLPNFSSHSCSVSVQVEVADLSHVAEENSRLYRLLQGSVDEEIQKVGFLPDPGYGMNGHQNGQTNGNGHSTNGNGQREHQASFAGISEKQIDLINDIIRKNNVNKSHVEELAVEMFGGGVRTLTRTQASNLIDTLFAKYATKGGNGRRREPARS